jgi:hypothetical protein
MKSFHRGGRYHLRTSWMPPGEAPAAVDLRPVCGCNLPGFNRARPRSSGRSSRPRGATA